jgi:O-antigen/teichoic acid export membrane protein
VEQSRADDAAPAPAATPARSPESLIGNSAILFAGQIGVKIITFLFNLIVIRHLGSEQFGFFAIATAFGSLFVVLADLGLAQLATKRIARDRTPATVASLAANMLTLRIALSFGVVILTTLAAWIVGYNGQIRVGIVIAAAGLISYAFFGVAETLALGLERFRLAALLTNGVQFATLILAAIFVFSGAGFLGLLAATTIGVFGVALLGLRHLNHEFPLRSPLLPRTWPGLFRDALPFAAITLALSVSYKIDAVILSLNVPANVVGSYTVAYNLIFTTVTVSHSINLALYPAMAREHAQNPERAVTLFRQGVRALLFVSLPTAVFISLNATAIIAFLYGPSFADAARPLAILGWAIPLLFVSEFLGYVAIVVDRERLAARANWASSLGNVAANLLLIPRFGVLAAALITVCTEGLLVGQYLTALRRQQIFAHRWQTYGAITVSAALVALLLLTLRPFALPLPILAPLAIGAYFLFTYTTGAFGREEIALIARIARQRRDRAK